MRNTTGLSQREIFELYDDEWIDLQGTNSKLVITREEAEKRNLAVSHDSRRRRMPSVQNPPFALFDDEGKMFPVSVASLDNASFQCFLTSIANGAQGYVGSVFQILNPVQRVGMLKCFTVTFQHAASGEPSELAFDMAFGNRIEELQQLAQQATSANMQAFNAAIGIVCNDIANHYPRRPAFRVPIQPFNPTMFDLPKIADYAGDGSPIIGLGRPMTNAIKKMNDGRSQMPNVNGANKTQPIKTKKRRIDHS